MNYSNSTFDPISRGLSLRATEVENERQSYGDALSRRGEMGATLLECGILSACVTLVMIVSIAFLGDKSDSALLDVAGVISSRVAEEGGCIGMTPGGGKSSNPDPDCLEIYGPQIVISKF